MNRLFATVVRRSLGDTATMNFGWLVLDKAARLVVGFAVGTWVARYLGPADYGTLNYGLSVTIMLALLPTLGLDYVVRRELIQHPEAAGALLGTTFWLKLSAGVLTYGLTIAGAELLEPDHRARFVIIVSAITLVQHAMSTFDIHFQARLQARFSTWAQNAGFLVAAAGRVILVLRHAPLEAFVVMLMVELPLSSILMVVLYRRSAGTLSSWHWDFAVARRLLRQSWPLAIAGIATAVFLRADQVLLSRLRGVADVGQYAAAYRLLELAQFLPIALASSLTPAWLEAHDRSSAEYERASRRMFNRVAMLAWALAVPGMLLAPLVVPLLYGGRYHESAAILAVLLAGFPATALGVARQQYLVNEGLTRLQLVASLTGMGLCIALNLVLIPRYGAIGAAMVSIVTHLSADVLLTFAWPQTRRAGVWQLRALVGAWRLPPISITTDAKAPATRG